MVCKDQNVCIMKNKYILPWKLPYLTRIYEFGLSQVGRDTNQVPQGFQ